MRLRWPSGRDMVIGRCWHPRPCSPDTNGSRVCHACRRCRSSTACRAPCLPGSATCAAWRSCYSAATRFRSCLRRWGRWRPWNTWTSVRTPRWQRCVHKSPMPPMGYVHAAVHQCQPTASRVRLRLQRRKGPGNAFQPWLCGACIAYMALHKHACVVMPEAVGALRKARASCQAQQAFLRLQPRHGANDTSPTCVPLLPPPCVPPCSCHQLPQSLASLTRLETLLLTGCLLEEDPVAVAGCTRLGNLSLLQVSPGGWQRPRSTAPAARSRCRIVCAAATDWRVVHVHAAASCGQHALSAGRTCIQRQSPHM